MPPDSTPRLPTDDSPRSPELSIEAELATQDWRAISLRLTRYAHVRLRKTSWATAEEIAQEAIVRLLDPAYASWDRERHPDVFDCLGHIVNGLVANYQRKAQRTRTVSLREDALSSGEDEPRDPREARDDTEAPDDAVVLASDEGARPATADDPRAVAALAALRASMGKDALALALLDRIQSGDGKPASQARALGVSIAEIYAAKRRILHHARLVGLHFSQDDS